MCGGVECKATKRALRVDVSDDDAVNWLMMMMLSAAPDHPEVVGLSSSRVVYLVRCVDCCRLITTPSS